MQFLPFMHHGPTAFGPISGLLLTVAINFQAVKQGISGFGIFQIHIQQFPDSFNLIGKRIAMNIQLLCRLIRIAVAI